MLCGDYFSQRSLFKTSNSNKHYKQKFVFCGLENRSLNWDFRAWTYDTFTLVWFTLLLYTDENYTRILSKRVTNYTEVAAHCQGCYKASSLDGRGTVLALSRLLSRKSCRHMITFTSVTYIHVVLLLRFPRVILH